MGDPLDRCRLCLFCDADYAGDKGTCKSTSGVFAAVVGPSTFVPSCAVSKKQGCVSACTCEAEMVALAFGLRSEGLPLLDLWESAFVVGAHKGSGANASADDPYSIGEMPIHRRLLVLEDNESTITVAHKGNSKQLN